MTVSEAFEEFILTKQANGLSEQAVYAYRWQCKPLVSAFGESVLSDITTDDLKRFFADMECNKKWGPSTKVSYRRSSRIFLKWCAFEYDDIVYRWDKIKLRKMPKKEIQTFTDEQIKMLFSACVSPVEWIEKRNCALLGLLLDSGIRRAEASSLLWDNIDLNSHRARVCGKGNKQRLVAFGDEVANMLREYLICCPFRSDFVFLALNGNRLTNNGINQIFGRLKSNTGLSISPHICRHNFATNYCLDMREEGYEVDSNKLQALMGHEDITVTKRYMHDALELTAAENCPSHLDIIASKKTAV